MDQAMPEACAVTERELLRRVDEGLPAEWWADYHRLVARQDEGIISESCLATLIAMTDDAEERHAGRLEAIVELAKRRGTDPAVLTQQMGLSDSGRDRRRHGKVHFAMRALERAEGV